MPRIVQMITFDKFFDYIILYHVSVVQSNYIKHYSTFHYAPGVACVLCISPVRTITLWIIKQRKFSVPWNFSKLFLQLMNGLKSFKAFS